MRHVKNYELKREPFERPLLTYRDKSGMHTVDVNAGVRDEVEVFRENGRTYVLTWNGRLNYAGLEAFLDHDKVGELFLQNSQDLEEVLGKKLLELTPMSIVKRLGIYLEKKEQKEERG